MDELKLVQPDESMLDQIADYRSVFLRAGDSMDGCGPLRRIEDPAVWLAAVRSYLDPATVPDGLVQATQFCCVRVRDGKLVGMLQVRHTLNAYLREIAGHIGYSVRPDERRKGYAGWMLKTALPFCRSIGLDRVMISCADHNEASRRTILANGGVYEGTAYESDEHETVEKYWITL